MIKTTTPTTTSAASAFGGRDRQTGHNATTMFNYYASSPNPFASEQYKINVDNAWNPVDNYIYGPTSNSIFNQVLKDPMEERMGIGKKGLANKGEKDILNAISNGKYPYDKDTKKAKYYERSKERYSTTRKLVAEFYDNETPKLCDHVVLEDQSDEIRGARGCTPLESYVSTGRDMKIEFHSLTGTALFPAIFEMKYEFVDTDLGGELWPGKKDEEVPPLCSRVFRKRKGNIQGPRNTFLHGRGGAKNISCLYRFEASLGERVVLQLHNVSFGDAAQCSTEPDPHTQRPKCTEQEVMDSETRIAELKFFDVPQKDVKIPLGCFCDNTSSSISSPITIQSHSKTMELTFFVTRLNASEDFADIYFYASYEFVRIPECRKKTKLKGSGGEESVEWPLRRQDATCDGLPWVIEAQEEHRSLFIQTWGTYMPVSPTIEDIARCPTKNRLVIHSGRPLRVMRVICPSHPGARASALQIFSEDWMNQQPGLFASGHPITMVLEAINRDTGKIAFSWLEIQRTKASLIQQLDMQSNNTLNETYAAFGLLPKMEECEHKCPEIDACIGRSLWCDGK